MQWGDLAEHIGTIVTLLGLSVIAIIAIIRLTLALGKMGIANALDEIKVMWQEINLIKARQMELRASLPLTYITRQEIKDDISEIKKMIMDTTAALNSFMADCRTGNCPAGRHRG